MRRTVLLGLTALGIGIALPAAKSLAVTDWLLNSWETGTEGWVGNSGAAVSQSPLGATNGTSSMQITKTGPGGNNFAWSALVEYNVANVGDPIQVNAMAGFNFAGTGNETQSWLEFDVTFLSQDNPVTWMNMLLSINSANGWTQTNSNLADAWVDHDQTIHVVTPMIGSFSGLGSNKLPDGNAEWVQLNLAINGGWLDTEQVNIRVDNLHLFTPDVPEPVGATVLAACGGLLALRRRRGN